jgi:hypothetical protein
VRTQSIAALFVAVLTVSGCDKWDDAKAQVRAHLKDPDSATWRNLRNIGPNVICGEVNAKNSLGGYTGFEPFMLDGSLVFIGTSSAESVDIKSCCAYLDSLTQNSPTAPVPEISALRAGNGTCTVMRPALF